MQNDGKLAFSLSFMVIYGHLLQAVISNPF